jgi:hypothetical protein
MAKQIGDGLIKIDGQLIEEGWTSADNSEVFYQIEPNQGQPAELQTTVRVLYDNTFLYVGAYCFDSLGRSGVRVQNLIRDFDYLNNDCFGISIDLFNDQRNCVSFLTTPYGTQRELQVFDDQIYNESWDAVWYVKTLITDNGWSAELAIPWKSLKYKNGIEECGVNFFRNARRKNEFSAWALYPRAYSPYRMEFSGILRNIKVPPATKGIRLNPYTLLRLSIPDSGALSQTYNIGTELKWAIKPNTILEATINSDFAQADVDRQIINLNRFSILFPERRQFFLDNAGIFTVGSTNWVQPFFSRTIGLDKNGSPIPIIGGVRFIHQNLKQNIGGLFVRTEKQDDNSATDFFVGRYSNNITRKGRVGGLLALRFEEDSLSTLNSVGSIDGFVRFSDALSWQTLISLSNTTRLNNINIFWNEIYSDRKYQPGTGFVAWNDLSATEAGFDLFLRPKWKPSYIRDFEPAVYLNMYHNASDYRLKEMYFSIWPIYILFQDGSVVSSTFFPTWVILTVPFEPTNTISIPKGSYQFNRYQIRYSSDVSRKIGIIIYGTFGGYYKGNLISISGSFSLRPSSKFNIVLNYEKNWLNKVDGNTSFIITNLISTEVRFAFNSKIQLTTFYQYNSDSRFSGLKLRFAWEFKPLSFLYIVFNSAKNILHPVEISNEGVLKINYVYQF